jgi:hypothetical protein
MRDMSWYSFVEQPDVIEALRKINPKVDGLTTHERRQLVQLHAMTVFESTPPGCPGMDGSLSVIEWEGYYIVVSRSGDCYGPACSFQEVIDAGALPTGEEDPVVDCSLSDEDTFAMAAAMVGLGGGIVINGVTMVVNEERLTPDWRAPLGEERGGLVCLGSGNHCDYFTWDEAEEWLIEATEQYTQLRDGIDELGGDLESFEGAPYSYESFITDTLGLELHRYFYDRGPGASGYEIYAWGSPGADAREWVEIFANVIASLKGRLPKDVDEDEIGDDLDALFELLREHDIRL